nr:MAG TPA: GDSL like Lipase Acylhydrolase [Caudoviricetes sp.]
MENAELLKSKAEQVANATQVGENTAQRIGDVFRLIADIISQLLNNGNVTSKTDEEQNKKIKSIEQTIKTLQESVASNNQNATNAEAIQSVRRLVERLQEQLNTIVGENATTAIENFNEVKNFLAGLKDSDTLTALLAKVNERLNALERAKPSTDVLEVLEFDGFTDRAVAVQMESATGDFKVLFDATNKRFVAKINGENHYSAGWILGDEGTATDSDYQTKGQNPRPFAKKIYINRANNTLYRWNGEELIQVSDENSANTKANYVKKEVDLKPTFVKGGFIDNKNSVVNYANASYCKDLSVKGFDKIKTNAGWFSSARTLLLDDDGRVLKNVTYENENGNSTSEKIIDLTEFPNVAKISISTGHENTYVIGQKTTKTLIQDYLLKHDLSKITELEDELKPLTIFTRSEGFYNDSLVWNSATNKFSVKHTDINLLKVGEGMKFNYKGFALGSAVNYAFFDESKSKISSVVGKDLRAGVEVVIPSGVKYVFFQSFSTDVNPESVVFSLVTKDWFRPYIESLIDVKALSMLKASNVLWGKKYVAIGDSFTDAIGTEKITEDGVFKGSPKVYPYIIGNRNNMGVLNQGASGTTLNQYIVNRKFESIPNDVDYITIWFGINDKGHGVQIGSATDKVEAWSNEKAGSTGAAFNYIFEWIFTNRPFAHVGVIVTDFAEQERRNVIIDCCKRWGVAFLDLYSPTIPMIRTRGEQIELDPKIKEIRGAQFALNGASDMHPNNKAHQWQSSIIENFMRGL